MQYALFKKEMGAKGTLWRVMNTKKGVILIIALCESKPACFVGLRLAS